MNAGLIDEIVRVFDEFDTDNSGALELAEVTKLASRFFDGRTPTEQKVAAIFRGVDRDADGKITLDELIAGAQRMHRAFDNFNNGRKYDPSFEEATEHVHL